MDGEPFASKLARQFRLPIAVIGGVSALIAVGNLALWVPDDVTTYAALAVAAPAATLFLCATFDPRLQRAVQTLNAANRAQGRWASPLDGDKLLAWVSLCVILVGVASGFIHRGPAAALSFAACFLVIGARIVLIARAYTASTL